MKISTITDVNVECDNWILNIECKQTYDEDNTDKKDQQEDDNIDKCTHHDEDIYKCAEHKELQRSNTIYNKNQNWNQMQ